MTEAPHADRYYAGSGSRHDQGRGYDYGYDYNYNNNRYEHSDPYGRSQQAGDVTVYESSAHDGGDLRLSYPGDPISAPKVRRGSTMGGALLVILALSASGWGLWKTEAYWWPWARALTVEVVAALQAATSGSDPSSQTAAPQTSKFASRSPDELALPSPVAPVNEQAVRDAPGALAGTPVEPAVEGGTGTSAAVGASQDGATAGAGTQAPGDGPVPGAAGTGPQGPVVPLPPLNVDPTDPYQKRALAAGLHPDLSRVLLSRLSDTDYRNARVAITKALREVGNNATLVWPHQRVPKHALFKVHFVAGAAAHCRRYVVTITKDGWSTTAQPMERCAAAKTPTGAS